MLELFSGAYTRAVGIDASHAMLAYARAKLDRAGLSQAQVRHGDICNLGLDDGAAGAVVMHQVLHFLSTPSRAIEEAARILAPGGKLLLVDFAPHELEFLREDFAHVRLGFAKTEMSSWLDAAGLELLDVEELKPPPNDAGGKVTVSIWLAERSAASGRKQARRETSARVESTA